MAKRFSHQGNKIFVLLLILTLITALSAQEPIEGLKKGVRLKNTLLCPGRSYEENKFRFINPFAPSFSLL